MKGKTGDAGNEGEPYRLGVGQGKHQNQPKDNDLENDRQQAHLPARRRSMAREIDAFAKILAGLEMRHTLLGDTHLRAGLRVTTYPGGSVGQRKRSEAAYLDAVASRETVFLFNNLLLTGFTLVVILGTLFPLVAEAFKGVKVTVVSTMESQPPMIADELRRAGVNRKIHLFDSFEGLSKPGEKDGTFWSTGGLSADESKARQNLAGFSNAAFYRGWIPERFPEVGDRSFALVHIDVDLYQPTLDSLAFFYPRMVKGGLIICDDYGFTTCPGAREAMDSFFGHMPELVVHLPTGQGLVLKE
jgi:hypothetical protein